MVYVVKRDTKEILNRGDAWERGVVDRMYQWIDENGFTAVDDEITFMGDMVIWVK